MFLGQAEIDDVIFLILFFENEVLSFDISVGEAASMDFFDWNDNLDEDLNFNFKVIALF